MSETRSRVIALNGCPVITEFDKAAEAIKPGHLVNFDGSGDLVKHATAGGFAARAFALERDELGNGIDVDYATNDVVKVGHFHQGLRVNAIVASGAALAKGAYVESAGNGKVRVYGSGAVIAQVVETQNDAFEAGTGDARIKIEIL
jgi:hypothetical protein